MKYFGTDGIRGKYNDVVTNEIAYKLGRSLVLLDCSRVVVGSDTRISSESLLNSVIDGALSVGLDVVNASVIPTPGLVYYSKINNIVGVMITASHNPYFDNGLKVVKNGLKLTSVEEELIERILDIEVAYKKYDNVEIDNTVKDMYLNLLENYVVSSKLKITIDCANGATCKSAPYIFNMVTKELNILGNKPNGTNINDNVGSTHLENIINDKGDCDIAFSFDGDGDRVLIVENNKVIDGDQIIYIIAKYLQDNNLLNNNKVVLTQMSNIGILKQLDKIGIGYVLTSVGDKHVVKELIDNDYSIGGENSGHIILPEILPTGDGVLVALLIIKIINEYNCSLTDLLSDVFMYEDIMVNLKVNDKSIIYKKEIVDRINDINNKIDGKVIVRKSGTENLIRISVMGTNRDEVLMYLDELSLLIGG